jgi:hypothetical protein
MPAQSATVGDLMPLPSSVIIVASPRPRVGKTLLARMLVDFHLHEGRVAAGFDLNSGDDTLAQFLPEHAATAAIGDVAGQMALFDRLIAEDGVAKVVDLGHDSFAAFFDLAGKIGVIEEASKHGIVTAVLFLLTPDASSVEAYASLSKRFPGAMLVPVHNEILGPAQHRGKYPIGSGALTVRLPLLGPALRKHIDRPPFSFAALATDGTTPEDTRVELQHWQRRVHIEFRELTLRLLLADLGASIRIVS